MTKVIAMHLPQYHTIKENDEWWGKGFTEWSNVKRGMPLIEGHLQPRIPYRYYDLADERELINQMVMASQYGVDGFAFYHYWFGGKKLLEKPVEKLLEYDKTPIDYCLCWANESWSRRWDGKEKDILIKQEYGNRDEWAEHYRYLSRFFVKRNYIKKDNSPIIIIYNKRFIPKAKEMYGLWKELAKEDGFEGLHIIDVHRSRLIDEVPFLGDAVMRFEPFATLRELLPYRVNRMKSKRIGLDGKRVFEVIDYEKFCDVMVGRQSLKGENQYLGFFAGWDNSPRIGDRVSILFENNTPEVFKRYFDVQYKKSINLKNDYMFINAWNEWGEGTFLEPDKEYGFGYLNAIKKTREIYE